MTRWVAILEDHPEEQAGWVRKQYANDHFAYLKMNTDTIRLAGGLRAPPPSARSSDQQAKPI